MPNCAEFSPGILKHASGAIVDIEFVVQYAVLEWAAAQRNLSRLTDVMQLLDALGRAGVYTEAEVFSLQGADVVFRASVHRGWMGFEMDFESQQAHRWEVRETWERRILGNPGNAS